MINETSLKKNIHKTKLYKKGVIRQIYKIMHHEDHYSDSINVN